jgi:nitrogen-specific signal transduction histidine kinase
MKRVKDSKKNKDVNRNHKNNQKKISSELLLLLIVVTIIAAEVLIVSVLKSVFTDIGYKTLLVVHAAIPILLLSISFFLVFIRRHNLKIEMLKKQEYILAVKENKFQALLKYSPMAVELYDSSGLQEEVNSAYEKLWNIRAESTVGKLNILEDPKIKKAALFDCVQQSYNEGFSVTLKHEYCLPSLCSVMSPKKLKSKVFPVKDPQGNVVKLFIIHEDQTEVLNVCEKLKELKREAVRSDQLKTRFLSNISHEIRTPLNWISGFSSLLQQEQSRDTITEYTNIINKSAQALLSLVEKLINLSLLEADEINFKYEDFKINDLLAEIHHLYVQQEPDINNNVEFRINSDLTDYDSAIYSDRDKLKQVLQNLISNALKFTQKGIIELGCSLKEEGQFLLYVMDSGIGIPDTESEFIFDKFRQLDESTSRVYNGAGLGLSVAKGLIEKLDGDIWFESKSGEGSTFYVQVSSKRECAKPA